MNIENHITQFKAFDGHIREIDPFSMLEIDLVTQRMQLTLIDVLGEEKGRSMYSMEWLKERVLWHLDSTKVTAKIFLSENSDKVITGQAIARIEQDTDGNSYGYFSTIYVDPKFRRSGIATRFLIRVENWFSEMKMPKIIYNTAESNSKLIDLFSKHGYSITHSQSEMVQLTKVL